MKEDTHMVRLTAATSPDEMVREWRKGCSLAPPGEPEKCKECTSALIRALWRVRAVKHIEDLRNELSQPLDFPIQ